jgi:predicted DsbA family dithiol-disulfide isomerase
VYEPSREDQENMDPNTDNMITIDVYSDVVCPWCYIGERRLEQALAQRPGLQVDMRWRPFQLQPDAPPQGEAWADTVQHKFGGPARAQQLFARVVGVGAEVGIPFDFAHIASSPNTVDAHRLIGFAAERGREWEMARALFAAHFTEGRDLRDRDTLVALAAEVGLPADEARAYLESGAGAADVAESQETAQEYGITGVPFYVFNDRYGLSGAQPTDVFLEVLDTVQAEIAAPAG